MFLLYSLSHYNISALLRKEKIYFVSLRYLPLFRHRSTLVSTILRESVRFSIINIFLMIKNSFQVEIWPISHLNDSETLGRGLSGVKIQKISWENLPPDTTRSLCLWRTFGKSISIYPRSVPFVCLISSH